MKEPANESPRAFERACAWLSLAIPLVVTIARTETSGDFRGDKPLVTGLGFLPLGMEGWPGLVLHQASSFIPLGGRAERAAWVGAFAAALASRLLFGLARRTFAATERSALGAALALAAALTAVLSPTFQIEATSVGGTALGAALVLLAFTAVERLPQSDARSSLVAGALASLTLAESHTAALALGVALGVRACLRRTLPETRELVAWSIGLAVPQALFALALLVRSVAPNAWLDLGLGLGQSSLVARDASAARVTAYAAWLTDIGVLPFGLATFGAVFALRRRKTRGLVLPLVAFVLVDLALPARHVALLLPDPFGPTRLLALGALGVLAGLGVQAAALALNRARLPFAQPTAVLLVVFDFTLVFVGSEASAAATERRLSIASEVWTDEGLRSVPPNGILLARSEALAWRLWSAQLLRGERPDALVVPATLLERGALRRRLLGAEPALAPLLRDMALGGKPTEYALATLADARPLFVELDPSWDERLNEHVVPESFWLRFQPNPVGRSDRTVSLERAGRRFERVLRACTPSDASDGGRATREVVVAGLRERALFLLARRDHDTALDAAAALERLSPRDEVAAKVRAALDGAGKRGLTASR
ncbi:MAG TPA: hypothetical protein VMI54_05735 [Polyangiaceae bacterium]|nr:hypothetical protein [Polyangiaceae bacterium]